MNNISIKIKLNNKFILKDFYSFNFLSNNLIKSSLISDFIIIEKDERKKLCLNTIDNLIEKHSIYHLIKHFDLNNTSSNINNYFSISFDFDLINLVKHFFWKIDLFVNDFKIFNNPNDFNSIYNFIISSVFFIDGVKREGNPYKNFSSVYNTLNKFKFNSRSYANNFYNNFSFALNPEDFQPSGALNMSLIKKFTIQLIFDRSKLLNYISKMNNISNLQKFSIKLSLFTFEYNIIRYQAGISGLLFNK